MHRVPETVLNTRCVENQRNLRHQRTGSVRWRRSARPGFSLFARFPAVCVSLNFCRIQGFSRWNIKSRAIQRRTATHRDESARVLPIAGALILSALILEHVKQVTDTEPIICSNVKKKRLIQNLPADLVTVRPHVIIRHGNMSSCH